MTGKNISTPAALFLHDKKLMDEMNETCTMCTLVRTCIDEMAVCIHELTESASIL